MIELAPRTLNSIGTQAGAVGVGIYLALEASADAEPISPEEWVYFCLKAADEAYAEVLSNPPKRQPGAVEKILEDLGEKIEDTGAHSKLVVRQAMDAAQVAFRMCMPKITCRRATQAYIACVAAGVQRGYLGARDATSLLYTAQLALAAYPSRKSGARKGAK